VLFAPMREGDAEGGISGGIALRLSESAKRCEIRSDQRLVIGATVHSGSARAAVCIPRFAFRLVHVATQLADDEGDSGLVDTRYFHLISAPSDAR
jgi:hypothetical protein